MYLLHLLAIKSLESLLQLFSASSLAFKGDDDPPCFFWGALKGTSPPKPKQRKKRLFECRLSYIYCKVRMLCSRSLVFCSSCFGNLNIWTNPEALSASFTRMTR